MPATIHEHVALLHALVRKNVFAAWLAIITGVPWRADDWALTAICPLPIRMTQALPCKAITSTMAAAVDKHVALSQTLSCENIFAAWLTVDSCEARGTNKRALTAVGVAPARMARAFSSQAITSPMSTAIDEHVAFLDAFIHEIIFPARLTICAREPLRAHIKKAAMRLRFVIP